MIVTGCRKRPLVTVQRQERDGQYQWGLGEKAKFITKPVVEAWPVVNAILKTKQNKTTTVLMLCVREEQTTSRGPNPDSCLFWSQAMDGRGRGGWGIKRVAVRDVRKLHEIPISVLLIGT